MNMKSTKEIVLKILVFKSSLFDEKLKKIIIITFKVWFIVKLNKKALVILLKKLPLLFHYSKLDARVSTVSWIIQL